MYIICLFPFHWISKYFPYWNVWRRKSKKTDPFSKKSWLRIASASIIFLGSSLQQTFPVLETVDNTHIIPRIWPLAKLFSTQTSKYFQGLILSDLCLMWNLNRVLAWKSFSSYEDVIGKNRHTLKQNYYKTDIEKWVVTVLNSQIEIRQKKKLFWIELSERCSPFKKMHKYRS